MAIRLSIAFNTSAESWLNQQLQYDLWHAEKRPEAAPRGEKPTVHEKADALRAETSRIGPHPQIPGSEPVTYPANMYRF
jgi:plasmid maintenance system antidote protein VapI